MNQKRSIRRVIGYTLLEIMIVVALIGMFAALAIPSFIRVRKQSQGRRIVSDARIIDGAINAWALQMNKSDGAVVDLATVGTYSKTGSISTNDILGNPYEIGPIGSNQVRIATETKQALAGVSIDWGAY